ncbi:hypothetical protein SAMN02983003_1491 [Devosia enhydra]|uniref:Xaa-Pro dipeptidyl-peptidase C-terminal domain-containing protein n=1 Tax=Devosia enhydra TaxID=665118 RepID=A0A1K2HWJ5_9HYPH|nr:CocE/NonD family hydrolase [Devosia enhydra]SFZ83158.1 hypothetical protein SAMN02983003_1491 [Devosia enhydra]
MGLASFFLARAARLPKRLFPAGHTKGLSIPMRDGVMLEAAHYFPRAEGPHPTILMRMPYGLKGFDTVAECYAERGFNVLIEACRGTAGSGGEFDPLANEREDGLATLDWLGQQPWYDGRLGTSGPSYLGYAQWAICDALPERSAMSTKVTSAEFESVVFPGGALHLGLWLSWMQVVEGIRRNPVVTAQRMVSGGIEKATRAAAMKLPLINADKRLTRNAVPFWRRWLVEAVDNPAFWARMDHTHRLGPKTPPNHFISGWYDFMVDQLLRDYQTLVSAGHRPYLTVGPWTHITGEMQTESVRETLIWMRSQLLDDSTGLRDKPVRIHISGGPGWQEFDHYPPRPPEPEIWHLQGSKRLAPEAPSPSPPDRYRYDPAKPTPNVGGAMFAFTGAGPVDNAPLEKRKDVLVYTSDPLAEDVTVIGNVEAWLFARASLPTADFFVRLCDVDEKGVSTNICDGLVRQRAGAATGPDGVWSIPIRLHATAHRFAAGHRLRVIVASGAHPRFARNTGTDEPVGSATTLIAADIEVFHDPDHPSSISLPVCMV